jgi:hypothetical protein
MTTKNTELDKNQALADLVETAKSTRLSPAQESEAVGLAKASLLAGKAAIAKAVQSMTSLPWIIGVTAIVESWPELKAASRRNLLSDLSATQTEQGRRFRLSLARGMLSHDAPLALKLIAAVCVEMTSSENGLPSQKDSQIFSNVVIGKGKPWLLRLPIAEFKNTDAEAIIRCVIISCFPGQCPPLTQLSVIRWIAPGGRLATLPEALLESIGKAVMRWHPKMQSQLKADVPELPPAIDQALKAPAETHPRPRLPQERAGSPPPVKTRQPSPTPAAKPAQPGFDLATTLRQIEAHVHSLRSELNRAKAELAQKPESLRRHGRDQGKRRPEPLESDPVEIESLQRHNLQLEETVDELRRQLEDLAADHEDIATSMGAHTEAPPVGEKEQFKVLLGIKLRADHVEFEKLAKEPPDEVFREHYRLLLENVFKVLENLGVMFKD